MDSGMEWEAQVEEAGTTSGGHIPAVTQSSGSQPYQVYQLPFDTPKSDAFHMIDSIFISS